MAVVGIFSDIHIHPHSSSYEKLDNCLECLEWIYKECDRRNIRSLIFAGDLFHDRHRINTYAYCRAFEIINDYSHIKTYLLLGNHDMYYRSSWAVSSIKPLSLISHLVLGPETIEIEGLPIDFMPYVHEKSAKYIQQYYEHSKSKVLVGHLSISGAIMNSLSNIKYRKDDLVEDINSIETSMLSKYKKVFLGHFHAKQKLKGTPIEYIGSPLQLSFSEAMDNKGFILLDTDTLKTEFVENTFSPKYYILPQDVDFSKFDLENNYVRVLVNEESQTSLFGLKKSIQESYRPKNLEIVAVKSQVNKQGIKEIKNIENLVDNAKAMVEKYVENVSTELDKDQLIKVGSKLVESIGQEINI